MKKINLFLFAILLFTLFLSSCNKDNFNPPELKNQPIPDISVVVINSENTLKFKDRPTFESFVREINTKTENEKLLFCIEHNLESPIKRMIEADKELEKILNTSTDEKEFTRKYTLFKAKHSDNFLFKDESEFDFSPYSRFINSELESLINGSGFYMIGDSLFQAPTYKNINELIDSSIAGTRSTISNEKNYAIGQSRNRRCEMWMSLRGDDVYVKFVGKRKYWLGWFKNSMQFIAEYNLSTDGSNQTPRNNYFEFFESPYFGFPHTVYTDMNGEIFRIITKEYKELTVNFGRIKRNTIIARPTLTGKMEIWSSELNLNDRGIASVNLSPSN